MPEQTAIKQGGYKLLHNGKGYVYPVFTDHALYLGYKKGYKLVNIKRVGKLLRRSRKLAGLTRVGMVNFLEDHLIYFSLTKYERLEKGQLAHHHLSVHDLNLIAGVLHLPLSSLVR